MKVSGEDFAPALQAHTPQRNQRMMSLAQPGGGIAAMIAREYSRTAPERGSPVNSERDQGMDIMLSRYWTRQARLFIVRHANAGAPIQLEDLSIRSI